LSQLKRHFTATFLSALAIVLLFTFTPAYALDIGAKAAVLIDALSGDVLWEKNAAEPLSPASTTKVLTALLSLSLAPEDMPCTVSDKAAAVGESSMHLSAGEKMRLSDLLAGALLESGNDACVAIAENTAGSEALFVDLMNVKAALIGAQSTQMRNTNGLPDDTHLMSASDLAIICRIAMTKPLFAQLVDTPTATVESNFGRHYLKTTNRLLLSAPEVIGIKTGTTDKAGACLAAAMERDGRRVISVVFNSRDRFGESLSLLNYGVDNFINVYFADRGEILAYLGDLPFAENGTPVVAGAEGVATIDKTAMQDLKLEFIWQNGLKAPLSKDQSVGALQLVDSAHNIKAQVPLLIKTNVEKKGGFALFVEKFKRYCFK